MRETLPEILRRAIVESGETRYAIAAKAKVEDVLGLEVRPRKRKDG
jgi:hypothetical protein